MRMFVTSILAIFAVTAAVAAQTASPPLSQMIRSLEDKGYVVTDVEVGTHNIDVEATKEGVKFDIDLSLTGEILREERDQ